ncbi:NAD(P)H-binding protein [Chryseobacterium sp. A301]
MNTNKSIAILGCGWLGFPLAKALFKMGYAVNGSVRNTTDFLKLEQVGIEPFLLDLKTNSVAGDIENFLNNKEVLLISIPPKLRTDTNENFVAKIKNLILYIQNSTVKRLIFISSTSVYGNSRHDLVTEETVPGPETESGKQLLEVEQLLRSNEHFKTTIVRFGGLIGEDRNPLHFLRPQNKMKDPDRPINFIHLEDCLGILIQIIQQEIGGEIFNAVAPYHPTKAEYYDALRREKRLDLPSLVQNSGTQGKIITSEKLETVLKYTFVKPFLR